MRKVRRAKQAQARATLTLRITLDMETGAVEVVGPDPTQHIAFLDYMLCEARRKIEQHRAIASAFAVQATSGPKDGSQP